MSKPRYSAVQKLEAVRRVTEDGCSVPHVAREMGVGEGSLFFWLRRHRQFKRPPLGTVGVDPNPEVRSLVAFLRRARRG